MKNGMRLLPWGVDVASVQFIKSIVVVGKLGSVTFLGYDIGQTGLGFCRMNDDEFVEEARVSAIRVSVRSPWSRRIVSSWRIGFEMGNIEELGTKYYYFIDIDLESRQIIGWGREGKETVEFELTNGYHRLFLSKGQYNKLERKLSQLDDSKGSSRES